MRGDLVVFAGKGKGQSGFRRAACRDRTIGRAAAALATPPRRADLIAFRQRDRPFPAAPRHDASASNKLLERQEKSRLIENSIRMLTTFVAAILANPAFHAAAGMDMIVRRADSGALSHCRRAPLESTMNLLERYIFRRTLALSLITLRRRR